MAANTISLSSVSGTPQTEVEVVVSLDNSDAISALELTIPLGEHLQYVNGSAVLTSARSNGHQISAAQVAQDLRIYIFSFANTPICGNEGELLSFRLLLGNEPADYALTPGVVLSNAQGTSLEASVQSGQATILAPKLQIITEQIDYGHIPIRATYAKNLQLKNVGNLSLEITNIAIDDACITPAQTAITISPASTANVTLTYAPVKRGAITRELIVTSNAANGTQYATIVADPYSVNELHVGSASGIADSVVTISLTMNNMEPIVAMQCAFKLPKQLEYVANSIIINTDRNNGHQTLSTLRGDTLVLALFSMTNQPLHANDGEIATFQLRLNGSSGTYYLKPIDVVLSNVTEENMVSATSQGSVRINAPSISSNTSISFGNILVTEQATATYSIRNNGSAPLVIERATFLAEGYSVLEELPLTIANSKSTTITVAYQPSVEGYFSTTMNLYTNDPNNRLKTVALSGTVYEPNVLTLDGETQQDGTYSLSIGLENYTDIVAVQYDIHWLSDMHTSQSAFTPSARIIGHTYSITPMGNGTYRVIIFSMTNTPIAGHSGELHKLIFTPSNGKMDYCGSQITIDNVVISSANGKDKTSTKSFSYTAQQTKWATDSAIACDTYTWNNKVYTQSGVYVDTLSSVLGCDSIVTLHLTINQTQYAEETVVACDTYAWNGETYTQSGEYTYTTVAANGCDSVVTLHLTVNQTQYAEESVVACDSYTWNGKTYTVSGKYVYTTTAINGCDSIVTLHLTINQPQYAEEIVTACDSYMWNGETYTQSGEYVYTTVAANGCDSIVTLHLTINKIQYAEESVVACDSYTWNGVTYTASGDYVYTTIAANGCDSIVTLHLTINQTQYAEETVVACDSYTWNGNTYTQSGDYVYTTIASNGCDSVVTLHLTVNQTQYAEERIVACDSYAWNGETYIQSGEYTYTTVAANGCDSIVTLHLTINQTQYAEETVVACDSYSWNGDIYTQSGEYVYTTTASNGCDSVVTLHLTINQTQYAEETVVACDSYSWNGETYTQSGEYTYTTIAANGCDSIVTLRLTINNTQYVQEIVVACDSYSWNDETYTQSGEYVYTTTAANGCDSIVTLHLTINNTQYVQETVVACDSYSWNGETYTQSGEYVYTTTAANGCDGIVTLHLTINQTQYAEEIVVACDSYTWNGETYTQSGEYVYTTTATNGCDSIVTLHLTINKTQYATESVVACDSYTWNGETYTQSGEYVYTTTATNGCDSVVTLHLTINKTQYATESVVACDSYTWNGETYTQSGEYTYTTVAANGCDSVVTLYLTINQTQYATESVVACDSYTWNGETYTQSGEYVYTTTATNGCDSIVTLHLTINQPQYAEESVTACDSYTWNGVAYTTSGEYTYTTTAANGCDSVVTLYLTILPEAITETEELVLCPSELPYEWYGYSLTEAGSYTATEQYAAGCDSVIHELTLNVYVQTLPTQVTLPIVRKGEAIDVSIPAAEIQAHIAADTWYAPNALVNWYIQRNADWTILTTDPVESSVSEVVLKYAIDTDCGSIESEPMSISVETTAVDNIQTDKIETYKIIRDDKLWIIRNGKIYSAQGQLIALRISTR